MTSKVKSISAVASLAALGVVYGDIGTSPLYALKACFSTESGIAPDFANVTGILSLVFWAITWIVVVKYLIILMRADNHGEGGIMALVALLTPPREARNGKRKKISLIVFLGLFGAALLYGDGMITPAISVLSAVEGLKLAAPRLGPLVIPITVGILFALFMMQKRGTQKVGVIFGPIMLLWFLSIAAVALPFLIANPSVFKGLSPVPGVLFLCRNGTKGILVLTAVVLCITGAEALYADMGHFGAGPIRRAWFFIVYPALILNYFGQGALLISTPNQVIENPFFAMIPQVMLYPVIGLATCATVIASQALISGVFSMTQQAILLGFMPRFRIWHTSDESEGQIFIPSINEFLLVSCVALVIGFRNSDRLAGAYGIAVTGTMLITSLLFYQVSRKKWKWSLASSLGLTSLFVLVDVGMLLPNLTKILHGGWVPVIAAIMVFTVMTTWAKGRQVLYEKNKARSMKTESFLTAIKADGPLRVEGAALFMADEKGLIPADLILNYKHNKVVHEKVILLTLRIIHEPEAKRAEHGVVENLGHGFYSVTSRFGFKQRPNIEDIITACKAESLDLELEQISFFLARDMLRPSGSSNMAKWRKRIFTFTARNAQPLMEILGVHPDWVIETGALVEF